MHQFSLPNQLWTAIVEYDPEEVAKKRWVELPQRVKRASEKETGQSVHFLLERQQAEISAYCGNKAGACQPPT